MDKMGYRLGAILFYALAGKKNLSANELESIIYGALNQLDEETSPGDWIEFPSGHSFTKDKNNF